MMCYMKHITSLSHEEGVAGCCSVLQCVAVIMKHLTLDVLHASYETLSVGSVSKVKCFTLDVLHPP